MAHGGALEADLLRYYGADLRLLGRSPALTWRRLSALVRGLPPESATGRELTGGWTTGDYLLAEVVDGVLGGNWQRGNAGAKPRDRSERPKPRWRPGTFTTPATVHLTHAEKVARWEDLKARRAQEVGAHGD